MNSVRTLQEPNADIRQQRQQHRTLPPVIGHFAPVGAPAAGGVLIKFWGINFDGKQKKAQKRASKVAAKAEKRKNSLKKEEHEMEDVVVRVDPQVVAVRVPKEKSTLTSTEV